MTNEAVAGEAVADTAGEAPVSMGERERERTGYAGGEANDFAGESIARNEAPTGIKPLAHALEAIAVTSVAEMSKPGAVGLGRMRDRIFAAIQNADFGSLQNLLPEYGASLKTLLSENLMDPSSVERLEGDHQRFFEQLKASLITNRIQIRLELERVKASRLYADEAPPGGGASWQG